MLNDAGQSLYTRFFFYVLLPGDAGANSGSPPGEYYLYGVMETAPGFKPDGDGSFQFFFSYGALDRYGKGRWRVQNDTLVFNSEARPLRDFRLLTASKPVIIKSSCKSNKATLPCCAIFIAGYPERQDAGRCRK